MMEKERTISHFKAWNQGMVRTAALDQALCKLNSGTTWLTIKGNPERTISHFKAWNQGMVRTAALDQALCKLNSGTTWLTIKGNPGEGKTTVGYMALEELHKSGRQVFEVRSPDDFTEIIETCSRPVIMLDDVFGNLEFDQAEWSTWKPAVCPLLKEREHRSHEKEDKTSKQDVTVILIGRGYVLNSASVDLGRLSHFVTSDDHVIYIDHSVKKNMEEKRAIWETISKASDVELDKYMVDEILWIEVPHGFPHVCRLFTAAYKENKAINALEFFNKPLVFLNESVLNLFKDTSKRLLFKEMIKCEGKISRRELGNVDPTYMITQTANSLVGTYIRVEEDFFVFNHPSIYDSVAFQMCSLDPVFVIRQCHLSFIHERIRILFSEDTKSRNTLESGLVVYVDSSYADDLAQRFSTEIMARNFVHVLSHQAFTDMKFVGEVMSKIKKTLKSLLHSTDRKHFPSFNEKSFLSLVPSSKSPELLKYIDYCPEITLTDDDNSAILYWTCRYAASDVLTYLVNTRKSLDINIRFRFNETPLMIAAETRNDIFVGQILSLSPDLDASDDMKRTICHYLCEKGLMSSMTRVIESGADVDVKDLTGASPLSDACKYNQLEVVQLLIEKGARVDEKSLQRACRSGNLHIAQLLFEREPIWSSIDILNRCLSSACEGGYKNILQLLVDKGASVNASCSYRPPLHAACMFNQTQAVLWLLQQGADINSVDSAGCTALYRAAESASKDCVDLLLRAGSSLNIQNSKGDTALHTAARWGSEDCVDLLLKAGALANIKNKKGDTALHTAEEIQCRI